MNCSKCGSKLMQEVQTFSENLGLLPAGKSCFICGFWIEGVTTVVCPMPKFNESNTKEVYAKQGGRGGRATAKKAKERLANVNLK